MQSLQWGRLLIAAGAGVKKLDPCKAIVIDSRYRKSQPRLRDCHESSEHTPVFQTERRGLFVYKVLMMLLSLETVFKLLGTQNIPGSKKELKILCIRISELVEINGEDWIRKNRQQLIDEWYYIVRQGIIH